LPIFVDKSNRDGWAHLVSDLAGEGGRRELMQFGARIGLMRRLHRDSTYAEHYDIRGKEIEKALMEGAVMVSRRELAQILRRKKRMGGPVLSSGLTGS
jgi:hypothetical protein